LALRGLILSRPGQSDGQAQCHRRNLEVRHRRARYLLRQP
jgi:hypothetical protein